MARFVPLNLRFIGLRLSVGLGWGAALCLSLHAQQPMTPMQTTPAPAKTPNTSAAPSVPVLPPDTIGQYGKILTPSDQVAHPLKLKMPFPGVGEVKVPNPDELNMREKLEQLAKLSDAEIRVQLGKWPAYANMSLRDEGTMLQRIQDFRDYRSGVAKTKAHAMGLLTLLPDQQARFEKEYWDKRLQMDRELAKQFAPAFRAREQKLQDDLFREFSAISLVPMAQVPKPSGPVPLNKSSQAAAPMMPIKTGTATTDPASPPMTQPPR